MIDYREKYLKYKKKYLQTKNIYGGGFDPNEPIELTIVTDVGEKTIEVSPTLSVSNHEFRIKLIEMLDLDKDKYYTLSFGDDILYTFGQHEQQEQQEQQEYREPVSLSLRVRDMLHKKPIYTFGQCGCQESVCTFNDFGIKEDALLQLQEVVSIQLDIETNVGEKKIEVSPEQSIFNHEFWMNVIDSFDLDKNKYYALSFADEIIYTFGPNGQHFYGNCENLTYNDWGIKDDARIQLLETDRAKITFIVSDQVYREDMVREYHNEDITIYYPKDLPLNAELFMYLLVVAITEKDGDEKKWEDVFGNNNWGEIYFIVDGDTEKVKIATLEVDTYWEADHKYIISEGLFRRTRG